MNADAIRLGCIEAFYVVGGHGDGLGLEVMAGDEFAKTDVLSRQVKTSQGVEDPTNFPIVRAGAKPALLRVKAKAVSIQLKPGQTRLFYQPDEIERQTMNELGTEFDGYA